MVEAYRSVMDLRVARLEFREPCNTTWQIKRHGFQLPANIRKEQLQRAV